LTIIIAAVAIADVVGIVSVSYVMSKRPKKINTTKKPH
jgi:hypothetical protein